MDMLTLITELAHNPDSHVALWSAGEPTPYSLYCADCAQKSVAVANATCESVAVANALSNIHVRVRANDEAPLSSQCFRCRCFIRKAKP